MLQTPHINRCIESKFNIPEEDGATAVKLKTKSTFRIIGEYKS